MGKSSKIAIFGIFESINLKTEKNNPAYHLENFLRSILKKKFFYKIEF